MERDARPPSRRSRDPGSPTSRARGPAGGVPSVLRAPPARPRAGPDRQADHGHGARARSRGPSARGRSARRRAAPPSGGDFSTPATQAAEAGSQNTPSCEASQRCASRISWSLTAIDPAARLRPAPPRPPASARGCRSGSPTRPSRAARPAGRARSAPRPRPGSRTGAAGPARTRTNPFHQAVTLPALPTGIASASGAAPSSSQTSKAAVFWPSIRYGLIELTSSTGWRSTTCLHQLQRLVEVAPQGDHARAVHHGLGELAPRDLPLRHDHRAAHRRPAPRRRRSWRPCCRSRRR